MAMRISWIGLGVGALVGGASRVAVMALHFPGIVGDPVVLLPAVLGIVIGGIAGGTGRVLIGAVVGAGLSFLISLASLPLVGAAASLGAGTLPALWEVLAVGAVPGAIGGAAGQIDTKGRKGAPTVKDS